MDNPMEEQRNEPMLEDSDEVSLSYSFNNKEFSDYKLVALPYSTSVPFYCHKVVLCQLPYFRSLITTTMRGENIDKDTAFVKISEISLKIILSYLYQVKNPLSTIRLTTDNATIIFDEITSINYREPLLDLWRFISKNLPEKQSPLDEVLYMETAEIHNLPFKLQIRPRIRVLSLLKKSTIIYALKQNVDCITQSSYEFQSHIKFMWVATWCVVCNTKEVSRTDKFDVLAVFNNIVNIHDTDIKVLQSIASAALKLGRCEVLITYAGYLACGLSFNQMKEDPKCKERDIVISLEDACLGCGKADCKIPNDYIAPIIDTNEILRNRGVITTAIVPNNNQLQPQPQHHPLKLPVFLNEDKTRLYKPIKEVEIEDNDEGFLSRRRPTIVNIPLPPKNP